MDGIGSSRIALPQAYSIDPVVGAGLHIADRIVRRTLRALRDSDAIPIIQVRLRSL